MNKIIQTLLAGLLAVAPVAATVNSSKTFFGARDTLNYSHLFNTVSPMMEKGKDAFGADLSANVFYKQSTNAKAMAKYFGDGIDTTADGTINVATSATAANTAATTLESFHIEHDQTKNSAATAQNGMTGDMALKPEHRELGVTLQWTQCLDAVVEGLWVNARTAVVQVETDLNPVVTGETKSTADTAAADMSGKGLLDFFSGAASSTFQNALAKQKISTKAVNETGIANVEVNLGYNFMKEDDTTVSGSVAVVVPTGNTAKGVNMFEPVVGKGGDHWAIGVGLNTEFNVWKSEDKKHAINFVADAAYKYYFDAKQTRTLGLGVASTSKAFPAGHYAVSITSTTTAPAAPFANLGTVAMNVEPGNHFEMNAGFNGMHSSFCWDLGYNMFYKDQEAAKLVTAWANDTVSVLDSDHAVGTDPFGTDDFKVQASATSTGAVYYADINAARTPAQFTHSVVGSLGYVFSEIKTPIRVGLGGSAEFSSAANDALETWSLFGKVGINF